MLTLTAVTQGAFEPRHAKEALFGAEPAKSQLVQAGGFLICRGSGNVGLVGSAVEVPRDWSTEVDTLFPDTIIGADLDSAIVDGRFLHHVWRAPEIRSQIENAARTTNGIYKVNQQSLSSVMVPLPSLKEQRRIIDILDGSEALARKRTYARSTAGLLLEAAFHERVGDPTSPNCAHVRLAELVEFFQYGTSERCDEARVADAVPVLRIPNVVGGEVNRDDLKYAVLDPATVDSLRVQDQDILFVRSNGNPEYIGRCAVYSGAAEPTVFASYLIRARLQADAPVSPAFIQATLSMPSYRRKIASGARTTAGNFNISTVGLGDLRIPVPSREVHRDFLRVKAAVGAVAARMDAQTNDLASLHSTLLHRAFTGTL